mmetsp:Transcript_35624/g.78422  ORF Transcript_35624/g.78422 Transcript_35624/m.78422 type:complete len:269 (+) Transcript_35624:1064-1870(+)
MNPCASMSSRLSTSWGHSSAARLMAMAPPRDAPSSTTLSVPASGSTTCSMKARRCAILARGDWSCTLLESEKPQPSTSRAYTSRLPPAPPCMDASRGARRRNSRQEESKPCSITIGGSLLSLPPAASNFAKEEGTGLSDMNPGTRTCARLSLLIISLAASSWMASTSEGSSKPTWLKSKSPLLLETLLLETLLSAAGTSVCICMETRSPYGYAQELHLPPTPAPAIRNPFAPMQNRSASRPCRARNFILDRCRGNWCCLHRSLLTRTA